MGEQRGAVSAHGNGYTLLVRRVDASAINAVVLALELDRLTVERFANDLHARGQPSLALARRRPFDPGRVVLARGVPVGDDDVESEFLGAYCRCDRVAVDPC